LQLFNSFHALTGFFCCEMAIFGDAGISKTLPGASGACGRQKSKGSIMSILQIRRGRLDATDGVYACFPSCWRRSGDLVGSKALETALGQPVGLSRHEIHPSHKVGTQSCAACLGPSGYSLIGPDAAGLAVRASVAAIWLGWTTDRLRKGRAGADPARQRTALVAIAPDCLKAAQSLQACPGQPIRIAHLSGQPAICLYSFQSRKPGFTEVEVLLSSALSVDVIYYDN